MRLQTNRLYIEPLRAEEFRAHKGDPEALLRRLGTAELAHKDWQNYYGPVTEALLHFAETMPREWLWVTSWNLYDRRGQLVGSASFKGGPNHKGETEIGYETELAFRGCGYMTEAVTALSDWALAQEGVQAVTAITRADNMASRRVLEKSGFATEELCDGRVYWRKARL